MNTSYFICTAPRSGSTMLCRMLTATGVAGRPEAHFHSTRLSSWASVIETEVDPALARVAQAKAFIAEAQAKGRGEGTLFGLRLQGHSLAFFLKTLTEVCPEARSSVERIEQVFGPTCFLYLNREDKIGQALSYVRAQQSGLWHKGRDGAEIERLSPHQDPAYDFAQIYTVYQEMQTFDRTWRAWFAQQGISPYLVRYEDLSADPTGTLRGILREIERPGAADMPAADTARLSDGLTAQWRSQFIEDLAKTGLA